MSHREAHREAMQYCVVLTTAYDTPALDGQDVQVQRGPAQAPARDRMAGLEPCIVFGTLRPEVHAPDCGHRFRKSALQ